MITREEAKDAVAFVEQYMREQAATFPEEQVHHCVNPDGSEPLHCDDAADWCHRILAAAKRDDMGGCPLCRM